MQQPAFDMGMGMQRTDSVDSGIGFQNYGQPMFNPATVPIAPINMQQLQYQQSLLARAAPPMNNFYPNMQSGFGYSSGSPSVEHYRNQTPIQPPQPQMNPSPILGQSSFGPPGFGNIGMGMNAYGYAGMGMQGMGYGMQEQPVNGRRGRVR